MPKKTIYVADADLALFESAAELGGGLSPAIATALRAYVEAHACEEDPVNAEQLWESIELDVACGASVQRQRFRGRQVARVEQVHDLRRITYRIFLTARTQYAVYTVDRPDWNRWSRDPSMWEDPRTWDRDYYASRDRSLTVYPDLDAMLSDLPDDVAASVRAAVALPATVDLDI